MNTFEKILQTKFVVQIFQMCLINPRFLVCGNFIAAYKTHVTQGDKYHFSFPHSVDETVCCESTNFFCYMLLYCDLWRVRAQEHEKFKTQFVHYRGSCFKFRNWTSCVNFFCIFGFDDLVGLLGLHKNCSELCPVPICSCLWLSSLGAVKCAVRFHLCRTHHHSKWKVGSELKCLSIKR